MNRTALYAALGAFAISAFAAEAQITPFHFQTNFSTSGPFDPTKDVRLDSVTVNGSAISQFQTVSAATIISNDQNLLASVCGPNAAQDSLIGEGPQTDFPTGADIAASLGNLNLSSLVNTAENPGTAVVDVFFDAPAGSFFFWERGGAPGSGGNSDFLVEALSADGGTVLASYKIVRANYTDAGFSLISTSGPSFLTGEQGVGSIGLSLDNLAVTRLRLISNEPDDNGPDFKVLAGPSAVPEPGSVTLLLGFVTVGAGILRRRRK